MNFFHITTEERLQAILENGLDPNANKATVNEENFTYLTLDYNFIIENDPEFWRDNLILLEVDSTGISDGIFPDPEYDVGFDIDGTEIKPTAFYTEQAIQPERIRVLGALDLVPLEGAPVLMYEGKLVEFNA